MPLETKLKVVYVENDSALRGLVSDVLKGFAEVTAFHDFATGEDAIAFLKVNKANVALLDVSLGSGHLDGFATGKELRRLDPNLGIVLFSQNSFSAIRKLIDLRGLEAWFYVEKKADINMKELVRQLQKAASGLSDANLGIVTSRTEFNEGALSRRLTQRQDVIMSLLASGFEPKYIAERLEVSREVVRKDLSVAYGILVPDVERGNDLRICAILSYQRLIGNLGLNEA